jgi:cytidylate kinase
VASPLVRAEEAVRIDTTDMSIDQVVKRVMDLVYDSLGTSGRADT